MNTRKGNKEMTGKQWFELNVMAAMLLRHCYANLLWFCY